MAFETAPQNQGFDRRRVLGAAGAGLAALTLARPGLAASAPFGLGIASGSPAPDGFVLWTRITLNPLAADGLGGLARPAQVRWEVGEDEGLRRIVAHGVLATDPRMAHAVHVEVSGLQAARPYWYRFTALGQQSPIGRAVTAPAPGAPLAGLKLAIASCAHWEAGWFSAYRHMADENPDLVLFLGDYIYEYSYAASRKDLVRRHDRQDECRTLSDYRNRYALYRTDPDLQRLHVTAPCLITWDDHEVQNDYGGDWSQIGTIPPQEFHQRRLAAYQAFYEHMPLRPANRLNADGTMRLYGRQTFGDLLDITMLDGRQFRSMQPCPVGGSRRGHVAPASCADLEDPTRTMLGQEQERWLYDSFQTADRPWNLIGQGVLIAPYAQLDSDGHVGAFTDGWSGYGANRTRMLQALKDSGRRNTVFFGGDLHAFLASDLKADFADPAAPTVASEFVGTSITSDKAPDSFRDTLPANPHVKYFENAWRGYLSVDVTRTRMETRLRAVSERADRDATVSTLKTFAVEAGRPGVQDG